MDLSHLKHIGLDLAVPVWRVQESLSPRTAAFEAQHSLSVQGSWHGRIASPHDSLSFADKCRHTTRGGTTPVTIDEPWLTWIVSSAKTHEGRLFRGVWAKLAPGDLLKASSERYSCVILQVGEILRFRDFDAAFEALGKRLLPVGADTPSEALRIYRQWNNQESVQMCGGVVAVGVAVMEAQLVG
mmetsp:Transcript_77149/g.152920  ORF Transcript_77149/g.152920 Transcript_77149/m.152920 type:complete len:185 (-) Transcript_77149:9-563(-)